MNIQIGLPCNPVWLCEAIGWLIALIAVGGLIAITRFIFLEWRAQKQKKRSK